MSNPLSSRKTAAGEYVALGRVPADKAISDLVENLEQG